MVAMVLSCINFEIKRYRDIGRKSRFFSYPACIFGHPRRNITVICGVEKLEWFGYPTVEKVDDLLVVSTEYRRVTDRQTDISRQHSPRYAYASRGKNQLESKYARYHVVHSNISLCLSVTAELTTKEA